METYVDEIATGRLHEMVNVESATIWHTLEDAETEIQQLIKEQKAYQLLVEARKGMPQGEVAVLRRDAILVKIAQKKDFMKFLRAVLKVRSHQN